MKLRPSLYQRLDDACGIAHYTRKMPFNALVSTLRSKVELNWTRAIRLECQKTEHRFMPIFFSSKGI